jgi:peptidoglycan hydrolase CwlO-like protein
MSKRLIGLSILLLALSTVFGVLNVHKSRNLRSDIEKKEAARQSAENRRLAQEKELKARETKVSEAAANFAETENKITAAEAEVAKSKTEKADLQAKIQASEAQIAQLQKRIEENAAKPTTEAAAPGASTAELQAQLDDARKQIEGAEAEKALLADKIRAARERGAQLEEEKRHRVVASSNPGVRGIVLAVNQAYNFVVLNLGGRQGVEANSEMLVLRGGTLIGKIRVSSVEPATAIGDIISSSLARGVQVQPGDTVIYAGSSS